jgi:hypothetical protein
VTDISQEILRERLSWIDSARNGILEAIEGKVDATFKVHPTVDPLKVILRINLYRPLCKNTREPLRTYLRLWAHKYDCRVPIVNINDKWIQAEVLIKSRRFNEMAPRAKELPERFTKKETTDE